jgi:FkbM family methyltransferase
MKYYSQYGQDKWLDKNVFHGKEGGVFVEAGAFDGETHSNSAYFERERGWTGICVEPQSQYFKKLSACRKCTCIHAALDTKSGTRQFLKVMGHGTSPEFSGLKKNMTQYQMRRIRKKVGADPCGKTVVMNVGCLRLDQILVDNGVEGIDYLSLDMEGGELGVLRSIDLKRFDVRVVGIENNEKTGDIAGYMQKHGYGMIHRCCVDEIYQRI